MTRRVCTSAALTASLPGTSFESKSCRVFWRRSPGSFAILHDRHGVWETT